MENDVTGDSPDERRGEGDFQRVQGLKMGVPPRRGILAVLGAALVGCSSPAQTESEAAAEADRQVGNRSVTLTKIDSTELALTDQLACREPPQAAVAVRAMLNNGMLQETDDGGDGSIVFVPIRPLEVFGMPVVRMTGWQADPAGGAMSPFLRGPGTAPPNFISVTVRGTLAEARSAIAKVGLSEERYIADPSQAPFELQGEIRQPQKLIPGIAVEEGDEGFADPPLTGVVTFTCSASEFDFEGT